MMFPNRPSNDAGNDAGYDNPKPFMSTFRGRLAAALLSLSAAGGAYYLGSELVERNELRSEKERVEAEKERVEAEKKQLEAEKEFLVDLAGKVTHEKIDIEDIQEAIDAGEARGSISPYTAEIISGWASEHLDGFTSTRKQMHRTLDMVSKFDGAARRFEAEEFLKLKNPEVYGDIISLIQKNQMVLEEMDEQVEAGRLTPDQVEKVEAHTLRIRNEEELYRDDLMSGPGPTTGGNSAPIERQLRYAHGYLRKIRRQERVMKRLMAHGKPDLELAHDLSTDKFGAGRKLEIRELKDWVETGFVSKKRAKRLRMWSNHEYLHMYQDVCDRLEDAKTPEEIAEAQAEKDRIEHSMNNPMALIRELRDRFR